MAALSHTNKRSHEAMMTGSYNATTALATTEESVMTKKAKVQRDTPPPAPSPVVHVRNLPGDYAGCETDLMAIASPFGRVVNLFILRSKNQAFMQMDSVQSASALINYYGSQVRATIRGKVIYFQYSNRTEVTNNTSTVATPTTPPHASGTAAEPPTNNILHITVLDMLYPITIDVLYHVFSFYGPIQKIIIFTKNGFQSLVQYQDAQAATVAKAALDGQHIYSGCCLLRIQFSNLRDLTITSNSDRAWDFTVAPLPAQPPLPALAAGPPIPAFSDHNSLGKTPVLLVRNLEQTRVTPDVLFILFGVYGDVVRVKILYGKRDNALVQFANVAQADTAASFLHGAPLFGKTISVTPSRYSSITPAAPSASTAAISAGPVAPSETATEELTKDYTSSPLHRFRSATGKHGRHLAPPSAVLHVSSVNAGVSDNELRELFGRYGTVVAVKFFPPKTPEEKRRMALVEMASVGEGVEALVGLHNFLLVDSHIKVSFSKSTIRS